MPRTTAVYRDRFWRLSVVAVLLISSVFIEGCGGSSSTSAGTSQATGSGPNLIGSLGNGASALVIPSLPSGYGYIKGTAINTQPTTPAGFVLIPATSSALPAYQITPTGSAISGPSSQTISIQVPYSNIPTGLVAPFEAQILTYDSTTSTWEPVPGSLASVPAESGSSDPTFVLTGGLDQDNSTSPGISSSGIYAVFAVSGPPATPATRN